MKFHLNISFLLAFFLLQTACSRDPQIPSLRALDYDRLAVKEVRKERFEEALNFYLKILESDPKLPAAHSNIGVLFLKNKKNDEALKSLEEALKIAEAQNNLDAQFVIHYNLGVLYGGDKKIPQALEHYQAALEINPTSKETKHNIELLIQSGGGEGEGEQKDQKNNQGQGQGQDQKDPKDGDKKDDKDSDGKEDDKDKEQKEKPSQGPKPSPKYKPRPFQGEQLSESDVKKILGELKNQEQKIRANFEKKERKESKNEKDW